MPAPMWSLSRYKKGFWIFFFTLAALVVITSFFFSPTGTFLKTQSVNDNSTVEEIEKIIITTNPFNSLEIAYSTQGNQIEFSVSPDGNNRTWFVRGTGGGTLDSYTGGVVTYTPGTTNGEDIVSVSDGISNAFADVVTKYVGNTPTFEIKTTNAIGTVDESPTNVRVGVDIDKTIQFKALGKVKDSTTYKDITGSVSWTSTNPDVGDIVTGGLFTAVKDGTTSITAGMDNATSNSVTVTVNPTFPSVNPSGYEPHFNPNPVAQGYATRMWVFVESDTVLSDLQVVSVDLSALHITPVCSGDGTTIEDCNSEWRMTPAEFEGQGRWYYLEFRVPFTVLDGTYPVRVQATSASGQIDRHLTMNLRVVAETIQGDVNGDGQISILDAVFALQVLTGSKSQTSPQINIFADVNGNGQIDLAEAIYVLRELTK